MKFKDYINEISFDNYVLNILKEHSISQEIDVQHWKDTANMIAKSIEDEEIRFKKKWRPAKEHEITRYKGTNITQKIAMNYLFTNPTVDELVKSYKLSKPEAIRLLEFLDKNFLWYKDEKLWNRNSNKIPNKKSDSKMIPPPLIPSSKYQGLN